MNKNNSKMTTGAIRSRLTCADDAMFQQVSTIWQTLKARMPHSTISKEQYLHEVKRLLAIVASNDCEVTPRHIQELWLKAFNFQTGQVAKDHQQFNEDELCYLCCIEFMLAVKALSTSSDHFLACELPAMMTEAVNRCPLEIGLKEKCPLKENLTSSIVLIEELTIPPGWMDRFIGSGEMEATLRLPFLVEEQTQGKRRSTAKESASGTVKPGRQLVPLFKDKAAETLAKSQFTRFLAKHHLSNTILDSTKGNQVKESLQCHLIVWEEKGMLNKRFSGGAVQRFITDVCQLPCQVCADTLRRKVTEWKKGKTFDPDRMAKVRRAFE